MLDKYGKDGLVVIGVTLDGPKETKARESAAAYLDKQKVPFRNVALDVPPEKLPANLAFIVKSGVPGAFVFNRDNRYVKKLPLLDAKDEPIEEMDYDVVEKVVAEQIKKK
jgi:hypothetical protein